MKNIGLIKKKITKKFGYTPNDQELQYRGSILKDNETVTEFDIQCTYSYTDNISIRTLLNIFIRTVDGTQIPLTVDSLDTIGTLRLKIEEKTGLGRDEHLLIYKGFLVAYDSQTVDWYNFTHESVIDIRPKTIRVTIDNSDVILLTLTTDERMSEIKNRIEDELGIGRNIQILMRGDGLIDDGMTIGNFGFGNYDHSEVISDITCLIKPDRIN